MEMRPVEAALTGDLDAYAILEALFWVGVGGALLLVLLPFAWPRIATASGALLWTLAYAAVALASALWSPLAAYTLFFALKPPIFLGLCLGLGEYLRRSGRDPIPGLLGAFFAAAIFQLGLLAWLYAVSPDTVLIDNPFDGGLRLTGGFLEDYGSAASTTLLFCAWLAARRRPGLPTLVALVALAAFAAWFLLLSRTRTVMVGTAISLLVFLPLARSFLARWWWTLLVPVLLLAGAAADPAVLDWFNRGQTQEQTLTFSRRDEAFAFLVGAWSDSPIGGYGYAAGQRLWMLRFMDESGIELGVAHDALSRVLIDLGLLGLVPLAIAFAAGLRESGRAYLAALRADDRVRRADAAMAACLAVTVAVQCLANSSLAGGALAWLLLVACLPFLRHEGAP